MDPGTSPGSSRAGQERGGREHFEIGTHGPDQDATQICQGEGILSRGPLVRAEILHDGERSRVTRLFFPERRVIRKEPRGPDARRRLLNETAMLERLRGVVGVGQLLVWPRYPGSIVLEDVDGRSVAGLAKPLAVDDLVGFALALAQAVAAMHARGVMHRDINPANIVISGDRVPCLVDFALATAFAELRPEFTHPAEILGTLPYLAPEQTGRTARSVDQRADLYALGATLYELATGEPPFGSRDPLRIIHDHLARVPVRPADVNRDVPRRLSDIVMHLLEKEPDNRYQTAEGVVFDLERFRQADGSHGEAPGRIGEHDLPVRLLPPSRLVGREAEVEALRAAFEGALAGRCRGVLVSGAPGVGKTALIDELRPVVTDGDGWYVAGKFDQYRRDLEFDAGYQAFRALGRLLLAEREDELAKLREQILAAVGPNAGLLAAVLPEFAALLAVEADPGDPLTAQARTQRAGAAAVRAVARQRPVVMVIDDLQWAGSTPLGFIDLVLSEEPVDGLLLVGAYREEDVDAAHPLAAPLARWRDQTTVQHLRLVNLPTSSLGRMVAEMLHVDGETVSGLAEIIESQTGGNPFETVELLNTLRRAGRLTATAAGWRWDEPSVRDYLGESKVSEMLAGRIAAMPRASRKVVEAMACLGGRVELSLLQTATGEPPSVLDNALAPALDDGLLVLEPGAHEAVRFRHDRIREATLRGLDREGQRSQHLAMARRLAAVPALFAVAAEQYLPLADAIQDLHERRQVVGLLRRAADQATLIGDYTLVNALLIAAVRLIDQSEIAARLEVHTARHAALYGLGRLDEADTEYRIIEELSGTTMERAESTAVQVRSLTHRQRFADAVGLGTGLLRELGITVPPADRIASELDLKFAHLYRWLDDPRAADDLARPAITDPTLLTACDLIDATLPAAYFAGDLSMHGWLSLEALRIWDEHGAARTLVGPASHTAYAAMALRSDHAAGYRAVRRILRVGEERGYEPGASEARFLFALQSCWFQPVEVSVQAAQRAREGLIAGGDLANAGYTYHLSAAGLLDCAQTLDSCVAEVQAGLAFARRTGGEQTGLWLDSYQWLAGVLRGNTAAGASEAIPIDRYAANPAALFHARVNHALAAAVYGESDDLARHAAAAMTLLPAALGLYPTALAHLLRGLALADQARSPDGRDRIATLAELDDVSGWLAGRAADAPENFRHLLLLVEAERAWALREFGAASLAFDAALRDVAQRQRPWHRALTSERAARFYLAHGLEHVGHVLLSQARREYLAWGATAKVAQLDWAYPTLRRGLEATEPYDGDQAAGFPHQRSPITAGTIDLLGILSASQALSSETSIEQLHGRVVEVLSLMTGATAVHLLQWSADRKGWLTPSSARNGGAAAVSSERSAPMSVLRYVQRTCEPLVVNDAAGDERFARDPYFAEIDCCSLLAVPIVSRGSLQAVLLLENRLIRGAFSTERLDAVNLIAGQLAVSLDNAQLYAQFRQIADEQAALRRVATFVAQGASPSAVFDAVAAEVGALLNADGVTLCRYEPGDEMTVVAHRGPAARQLPGTRLPHDRASVSAMVRRTQRPARIESYMDTHGEMRKVIEDLQFRSGVGAPIVVDGRLWGVTIANWMGQEPPPPNTEERMALFAELLDSAIANADSRDQLVASRARLLAAGDDARRRVVRDLHDGAQQRLVHTIVTLKRAEQALQGRDEKAESLVADALEHAQRSNEELRELAHGMLPSVLTNGGLGPAVQTVAARLDLPVHLNMPSERFSGEIEASAYFIVAEALTNVAKHSQATRADVNARVQDGVLQIEVRDDGTGGADPAGHGLLGISDRVTALGGRLTIESPIGAGTRLAAMLPLPWATDAQSSSLP